MQISSDCTYGSPMAAPVVARETREPQTAPVQQEVRPAADSLPEHQGNRINLSV